MIVFHVKYFKGQFIICQLNWSFVSLVFIFNTRLLNVTCLVGTNRLKLGTNQLSGRLSDTLHFFASPKLPHEEDFPIVSFKLHEVHVLSKPLLGHLIAKALKL